ncbi:hypothetical protein C2845_PM01G41660 [Panicum miliaceum]|uniref:Acetyltransferase n=1 Tax=Panicum miliaceum TaxID=4540 RepID=A0A3L6TEJ9_PANMI|nr:hypothetical protein C2845_PM01G41660 [Panicum miliaceum]
MDGTTEGGATLKMPMGEELSEMEDGPKPMGDAASGVEEAVLPDADVPTVIRSFFLLDGATNYGGHELPLIVIQATKLADGFLWFTYNHALCDVTSCWDFLNAWAKIARLRLSPARAHAHVRGWLVPTVLPSVGLAGLVKRPAPPPLLRERMFRFSAESLAELKERVWQELLAAGDEADAAVVTKFQALSSLLWRCGDR